MSSIFRETGETSVRIALDPFAGSEGYNARITTGEAFLDHMLVALARYAGFGLVIEADGDLRHHLIEDVAITLGLALRDEIPEACQRYGEATVVMDDAMVQVALDLVGRFYYEGPLPSTLYDHFLRSFAENARMTLHLRVLRGRDRHHIIEASFKARGLALHHAQAPGDTVFSTKGGVRIERGSNP
jgi:imidazoleglycerol-phosphate dehydratase